MKKIKEFYRMYIYHGFYVFFREKNNYFKNEQIEKYKKTAKKTLTQFGGVCYDDISLKVV